MNIKSALHRNYILKGIAVFFIVFLTSSALAQKQGLDAIDSMSNDLKKAKLDTNRCKLIYRIAFAYRTVDSKKYMAYNRLGIEESKKIGFKKGLAAFAQNLGYYMQDNGKLDSAIAYYQEAYDGYKKLDYKKGMIHALIDIGTVKNVSGNFIEAITAFKNAEPLLEATADYINLCIVYGNLSDIYLAQRNFNQCIYYIKRAEDVAKTQNCIGLWNDL